MHKVRRVQKARREKKDRKARRERRVKKATKARRVRRVKRARRVRKVRRVTKARKVRRAKKEKWVIEEAQHILSLLLLVLAHMLGMYNLTTPHSQVLSMFTLVTQTLMA